MFEAKLITQLLPVYVEQNYIGEDKEKALETIALFKGFTTYFTDYFNIRKICLKKMEEHHLYAIGLLMLMLRYFTII